MADLECFWCAGEVLVIFGEWSESFGELSRGFLVTFGE